MLYADYAYYSGTYMGTVSEEDFPRLAVRAGSYLDYITTGKAAAHAELDAVKLACCALVDVYRDIETAKAAAVKSLSALEENGAELQSQTVGSWSKTYRSGTESANAALSTAAEAEKLLYPTAMRYLAPTGLLYRGRGCRNVSTHCHGL